MIKEAIGTGETIEEAKENALALLGADITTDIDFEVIETPKKKTFGLFGGSLAKVRVFTELPDPKPVKKPAPPVSKPAAKPAPKKDTAQAAKPSQPAKPAVKHDEAPAKNINFAPAEQIPADSPAGRAAAYLNKIFAAMELNGIVMNIGEIDGGHQINLSGEQLGVIIGRRGETLDALQYLASLAANNGDGYSRIVLNTGNYREKRAETLQSLAERISSQVIRTGRSRVLEPMNPYERRIIHTAVQKIDGVSSNSTGDGANRRVVISPAGGGHGARAGFANRGGSRDGGYNRNRNGERSSSPRTSAPAPSADTNRTPKSDVGDAPLYGKIDLNK